MKKSADMPSHWRHLCAKAGIFHNVSFRVANSNIFVFTAAKILHCLKHRWYTREYIAGAKHLSVVSSTKANVMGRTDSQPETD